MPALAPLLLAALPQSVGGSQHLVSGYWLVVVIITLLASRMAINTTMLLRATHCNMGYLQVSITCFITKYHTTSIHAGTHPTTSQLQLLFTWLPQCWAHPISHAHQQAMRLERARNKGRVVLVPHSIQPMMRWRLSCLTSHSIPNHQVFHGGNHCHCTLQSEAQITTHHRQS